MPPTDSLPHLSNDALLGGLRSGAELLADERDPNERRALLASMRQYLECLEAREGAVEERRVCGNCANATGPNGCRAIIAILKGGAHSDALCDWILANTRDDGSPLPTARNCPGWAAKG